MSEPELKPVSGAREPDVLKILAHLEAHRINGNLRACKSAKSSSGSSATQDSWTCRRG
jgi:hypothetical protein